MLSAIRTIQKDDPIYPALLAQIHRPPKQFFLRGALPEGRGIAVVGTRLPSSYGKQVTPKIVEPLAAAGLVIVSGMAYGIDALAHEAALSVGGKTIAVLGTGVDEASLYPQSHRNLAERIVASGGAILSEYPPQTPGHPGHFPQRNRIVVGLSQGVLVIEGREKSGASITANLALQENRELYAVPGPITSASSYLPNRLIQEGATALLSAKDILENLGFSGSIAERKLGAPSADEQAVLDALQGDTLHVDTLGRMTSRGASDLSVLLVQLELKGFIKNFGGGMYGRI